MRYPVQTAAWLAALLLLCGSALADGAKRGASRSSGPQARPAAAAPKAKSSGGKAASSKANASLYSSLRRQARHIRVVVDGMRLRSDRIHHWLRAARRSGFARRSSCLNDLLSQSHAVERQATASQQEIKHAAKREDHRRVRRELSRMQVYELRSQALQQHAESCGTAQRAGPRLQNTHQVRSRRPRLPKDSTRYRSGRTHRTRTRWQ